MDAYTHTSLDLRKYITDTPCLFTTARNGSQAARDLFDRRCKSIEMYNDACEMARLWQQAKLHVNCVITARLMTMWNHSVGNFFNLVGDKVHVELDLAVPIEKQTFDQDQDSWYSFVRLLQLSEEFERKYVEHQFAPVSWFSYSGSQTNTNLRWLNPTCLLHTTQSGRCDMSVRECGIVVNFYSPSLGQQPYVTINFTSPEHFLVIYANNEVCWTNSRVDAVVSVLRAFGLDREDTYKHLNLATQNRSADACLEHKTNYQNWLHEQLKDPNFIDYRI